MSDTSVQVFFIVALLLANGVFAMAEIAVVAARKTRLKTMADEGSAGARLALELAGSPGRFLSTMQVGITLVGVLAGAIGGANIAARIEPYLAKVPGLESHAGYLSLLLVVGVITWCSVIIGELLPKRLALHNPERVAASLAGPVNGLARLFSPVVDLLNLSSDSLLALLGVKKAKEAAKERLLI